MKNFILLLTAVCTMGAIGAEAQQQQTTKMKILVHVTQGPENPTRAALAFLVAKSAIEEGHSVSLFLAGDAVRLLSDDVLQSLTGVGTGKLADHFTAIVQGGGKFYLSGMSAKARGFGDEILKGKSTEFAMPNVLVRLAVESDKMFVY
jgi:predicted peroxiredoxin